MAFTTLMVVIVSHFWRRFVPYGVGIIVLMGLSRIHNGMHYPTDVLIGIIMGLLYGTLGLIAIKKL
jgi:membrane-associated phospholipid phosphatase